MFRRVLVANRGEIAIRVLRTLRRLGIHGIAVHSDADAGAPYLRMADEAHRLGPAEAAQSYLNGERILAIARRSGAEAIHPGYGFLSENAAFAQKVIEAGLAWIGPPPKAMEAIGNKVSARALAKRERVPMSPGSDGALRDASEAEKVAREVGYPVILKAAAGGGGIGMRIVRRREDLAKEFEGAQSVARSAFGDDSVFLEKYIERPRHIELQVIGDQHGHLVHLGERECSIQRRHQKLVEEAPSPGLTPEKRRELGEVGLRLVKAAGYHNAGTLEFLYQDGSFYFNEVNARLQVEHPVTERIYGVDLVEGQLRVAAGERLPWKQEELRPNGHAIEVRINAEDPLRNFTPTPGPLRRWRTRLDPAVRLDGGVEEGWRVPAQYDSLLAKLVVWGADRAEAVANLQAALDGVEVAGTTTNLALHRAIVRDAAFRAGELTTRFLEERPVLSSLKAQRAEQRIQAMALSAALATGAQGGVGVLAARARRPPLVGGNGR